jgi:glycogen debranching enzyme
MRISDLLTQARQVLRQNDAGQFTKPGPRQYPHQWNWDSALIALGLSHFDLERALIEIRSLLSAQWQDGMLPHIVYHGAPSDYFPDPGFWQVESNLNAPAIPASGITQPPLLTTVIRCLHTRHSIPHFVREVYPALLRWQRWLHTARDADGSGLVYIIHPWESGTDDSPRWLQILASISPQNLADFRRGDILHVSVAERPYQNDYERFIYLIDIFRQQGYRPQALLAHSPFLAQDLLFNTLLYRADQDLLALARQFDEPTIEIEGWLRRLRTSFNARFWDERRGLYYDYDLRARRRIEVNTAIAFAPLFAGLPDDAQARRLVVEHLENPAEYAPGRDIRYYLTSTSKAEPAWEPRRYWRGPVWIILNWIVWQGLRRYGFDHLAEALRQDGLELITRSGFREYYDPRDGSGCGSVDFSWSAALAFELESGAALPD